MNGYWIQLFRPRANNDVKSFLPDNVSFVQATEIDEALLREAKNGKARLILECPSSLDGVPFGKTIYADSFKARSVVASDFFGTALPKGRVLAQHNFVLREVLCPVKAHLVAARVAGYRDACFGLDDAQQQPILFEHPTCPNILIATTPLSGFVTSRFAPLCDWQTLMGSLIGWLADTPQVKVEYRQTVRPAYQAGEKLPDHAEMDAFSKNAEWFYREMLYNEHGLTGVFEGYSSLVDVTGRQGIMPALRGDCLGECSAVGALDYAINNEPAGRDMAEGLLRTLFDTSKVRDVCPASQTYGSLFFDAESRSVYGDDNSRAGLGAVLAEELLGNPLHARQILEMGYSLLRTTGPNGLREPSLLQPESFQASLGEGMHFVPARTWKNYAEGNYSECHPHYQAWHWAFNLELYALSGDERFRNSAVSALEQANMAFPDFYWQNGATGDWARVLLPYAMLVEVEDTPEHRAWLDRAASYFIDQMNEYGTAPEVMGKRELGHYPSPTCNADYGKAECTLIQFNGAPACDLLYSINYAFAGMHEAAMATGNEKYKEACDKMADFLCRVQAYSKEQPYLNGAWLHGFDYKLWEFFSSASDSGWGPWSVETGWTNSWIATTFALRTLKRPLLSTKASEKYRSLAPQIAEEMFKPTLPSTTTRGTRTEINTTGFSSFAQG